MRGGAKRKGDGKAAAQRVSRVPKERDRQHQQYGYTGGTERNIEGSERHRWVQSPQKRSAGQTNIVCRSVFFKR
jgi:hypothetical protein